jgi:N-acyl homoserine lactone hydrolase
VIEARTGRYLLVGDCIDLYENWEGDAEAENLLWGFFTYIVAYDDTA